MQFITGLAIKPAQRVPMVLVQRVGVSVHAGIEGNFVRQEDEKWEDRMVTLLSHNQWNKAEDDLGLQVPWETRRANIRIMNVWFTAGHIGQCLKLGDAVVLEITGETTPCKLMDKFVPGLRGVLEPEFRAGVTCRVIQGGVVSIEDPVLWLN
jgi:MOSC domain-containing protein YiiM